MSEGAGTPFRSWSIVVPTRRRPAALRDCLAALARLEPPAGEVERIVVDDDPAGSAEPVARAVGGVTLLRGGGRGPAAARNLGASAASGSVLAFTDDDCLPEPGWLRGFAAALETGAGAAAGRTVNGAPGPFAAASQLVVEAIGRAERAEDGGPRFGASNNVCFGARPFAELGGFDESFPLPAGEDRDLCARWAAAGRRIADAPDALVVHRHELGPAGLWRQHYRYGRGARAFHAAGGRPRAGAQARFYRELGAAIRRLPQSRAEIFSAVALTQLAHAAGYASAVLRPRHPPVRPPYASADGKAERTRALRDARDP